MSVEPLTRIETSPGRFSLLLRDLDEVSGPFEAAGHTGNGYSWEALARHLLESSLSEARNRSTSTPRPTLFCANSDDRDALLRLAAVLAEAVRSRKRLAKLIASVPPTLWATKARWDDLLPRGTQLHPSR
jgi:hypothetical protein